MLDTREELEKVKSILIGKVRDQVGHRHIHGRPIVLDADGVPHRALFYPARTPGAPVFFDIHGGGFCWGMMEEGDLYCHRLNERLGFAVFSLDYPLLPEAVYPEALEYLYGSVRTVLSRADEYGIDSERVMVGGRSAGGNLAAALALLSRDRGEFRIALQVLDHPLLDCCGVLDNSLRYRGGDALPIEMLESLENWYATPEQRLEIYCSPLNAKAVELRGAAPAVIQTCEHDSLQLDGEVYAEKLRSAGVPVLFHCYPAVCHGFTEVEGPEQENGIRWLLDAIRKMTEGT